MTPCTALFWRALSRRSARRDNSLHVLLQDSEQLGPERKGEGTAVGCAMYSCRRWQSGSDSGKLGFPECGNINHKIHTLYIGYNHPKSSPALAFTWEQLSFMIPKDFSKWKEIIVNHPSKKPLPEEMRHKVQLRPLVRKLPCPAPQVGSSAPRWEGDNLYIFHSQGRTLTYLFQMAFFIKHF